MSTSTASSKSDPSCTPQETLIAFSPKSPLGWSTFPKLPTTSMLSCWCFCPVCIWSYCIYFVFCDSWCQCSSIRPQEMLAIWPQHEVILLIKPMTSSKSHSLFLAHSHTLSLSLSHSQTLSLSFTHKHTHSLCHILISANTNKRTGSGKNENKLLIE